jgi:hypothetical protein
MSDVCAIPGYVLAGFPTASARYCGDVEVFEITVRYKGKEATAQISRDGVRRYTASEVTAYFIHPLMDGLRHADCVKPQPSTDDGKPRCNPDS